MLRLFTSPTSPDPAAIAAAVDVIRSGGVLAFATDTLYGLAVDPTRDDAVGKLFEAKGRQETSAIPVIAGDDEQAMRAGVFGSIELKLARQFWPGPLTIAVPARHIVSRAALGGGETIGIRVPDHAVARALAQAFGGCITATSANVSGRPPAASAELDPDPLAKIDAILDSGPAPGGAPSTIVTVRNGQLQLLREGAIAWERVLRSVE